MRTNIFLLVAILLFSCESKESKLINEEALMIFKEGQLKIEESLFKVNVDSFRVVFENESKRDPQAGLEYANRFNNYSEKLLSERRMIDSIRSIQRERVKLNELQKIEREIKDWENSKYGRLQKKFPNWTRDECRKVADGEIWIGMTLEMLKYQRGLPNSSNQSNYGSGIQWQWCWDDFNPSCFYGGQDGIITAFN